jgi:non-reducing end alpha-L-arabinofuranosidase
VPSFAGIPLPCEVIAKDPGGARCVAAHSTVRVIVPQYAGPLYQLCRNGAGPGPSACKGESQDITAKDGYADSDSHEAFCGDQSCAIVKIYDQSGWGNDLEPEPKGGAKNTPDAPSKASALPVKINGHRAYGILIKSGMGYRSGCDGCTIKKGNGMALGDAPQSVYMVTSQKDLIDGCCFDYGNAETTNNADGNGAIEAVYFGGGVVWGTGAGGKPGPWVMADLENGLFAGWENGQDKSISTNRPLKFDFVTAVLLGDTGEKNGCKGRFALYGADASGADPIDGEIATMYDGVRPEKVGYVPMRKQGSLILGTSGDNSSGGGGRFYEGAVATGPVISKSTVAYLQAVIVAAKYQSP